MPNPDSVSHLGWIVVVLPPALSKMQNIIESENNILELSLFLTVLDALWIQTVTIEQSFLRMMLPVSWNDLDIDLEESDV